MSNKDNTNGPGLDECVQIAMMLLEVGTEGTGEEYGSAGMYACAAHSYLQFATTGHHSAEYAESMAASLQADFAHDAMKMN